MLNKIIVLIFVVNLGFGCLITNCPRGGKRGDSALISMHNFIKECTSCGPGDQGQCFGPNICCGSTIGCYIRTPETYKCRGENLYSRPCIAGFAMCRDNTARCAANGICCSQETCYIDSSCKIGDEVMAERKAAVEYNRLGNDNDQ